MDLRLCRLLPAADQDWLGQSWSQRICRVIVICGGSWLVFDAQGEFDEVLKVDHQN